MARRRHWTETALVDTVTCPQCGTVKGRTTQQVRTGVRFCSRSCACRATAGAHTSADHAARVDSGRTLGRRRARVVRHEGVQRAVEALVRDLQCEDVREEFFLRPEEWDRLRLALARAYSTGYQNGWRAAWCKYDRHRQAVAPASPATERAA
jgi:hypothetical protein